MVEEEVGPLDQLDKEPKSEVAEKPVTKKWVARPLTTVCGVCGSPATEVQHYGSISCYSCRAFFRRSVGNGKEYRFCSRKTDNCQVDTVSRTNCKKCRLKKCLAIGMKPEKVDRVRKKRALKLEELEVKTEDTRENSESELSGAEAGSSPLQQVGLTERLVLEPLEPVPRLSKWRSHPGVDLGRLAEECVAEGPSRVWPNPAPLVESLSQSPTVNTIVQSRHPVIVFNSDPEFELTFEEDFRIHELLVRKDNVLDSFYSLVSQMPKFHEVFLNFTRLCNNPDQFSFPAMDIDDVKRFAKMVGQNIASDGIMRQSLEMYDEYKQVDNRVKTETFCFSIKAMAFAIRAFLKEHCDAGTFVDQHIAAGVYSRQLAQIYENYFGDDKEAVRSFNPLKNKLFTSPWAVRREDEVFFSTTLDMLGSLVGEDTKLGTLFCALVLLTPGANLSHRARNDAILKKLQNDVALLIFRYLKKKTQNLEEANRVIGLFMKLVGDLHRCLHIHMHGRLDLPPHSTETWDFVMDSSIMQTFQS